MGKTKAEIMLEAAKSLPLQFTDAELIIASWKLAPDAFGMRNFPYPDTHRGRSVLDGARGLVRLGKFIRWDNGNLSFPLSKIQMLEITTAYKLFTSGRKLDISRFDAMIFWRVDKHKSAADAIEVVRQLLLDRDTPEMRVLGACHDYLVKMFSDVLCGLVNGRLKINKASKPHKPSKKSQLIAGKGA